MFFFKQFLAASTVLAVAHGQGVIIKAQGDKGSPASTGLQVDPDNDSDANFISQTEIATNVVNQCGRTLQAGNIDVGATTEDALADNQVTQVQKGSTVTLTINQVNETGAGPYTCDFDPTGNTAGTSGQLNLTTSESDANNKGQITIKATMPDDLACSGSSTGNVCTIRCRNANEFGGCVAVQQTDVTPAENTPANIEAFQSLSSINEQIQQNIADLPAAVDALATSGSSDAEIGTAIVSGIQAADPSTDGLAQNQADDGTDDTDTDTNTGNNNNGNNNNGNTNNNGNNNNNNNGNGNGNNRNGNGNNNNNNANTNNNANANANTNASGNGNGFGRGNRNKNNKREALRRSI
ncbi:hypothetical protein M426DRAFT_322107 [Hypoxylon sp. CI-4A]|nr:hypothetical protein M426DRAFT_322107 [Hypoxylon sp. CI-4A]